jgi:hypothetical protein
MSQEFETLVRPFQTNDVTPAQTYYVPGQIGVPNVILRLGRGGSGKVLTGNYSYSATFYCVKHEVEKNYQGVNQETGEPIEKPPTGPGGL